MSELSDLLVNMVVDTPQSHENMTIYSLHIKNGHSRSYQTLEEAITTKTVEILEVSEGGSVPNLTVRNTGDKPVLLVVGEELIGAKQNRVLNTTLLVPTRSELQIPVSCVEQGRWSYRSREFSTSKTSSHMKLRKQQIESVTENLRKSPGEYDANQGKVWGEVARKMSSHGTSSDTNAMHDMYDQMESRLNDYLSAFQPPNMEGMMVTINGKVVGVDVFDHAETLSILWPKLLRSYALDALEHQTGETTPQQAEDTQDFLKAIQEAKVERYDSVGLGKDVRVSSDRVTGSGLLWEDKIIHASLFNSRV